MRFNTFAIALLATLVSASSLERRNIVPQVWENHNYPGNANGEAEASSLATVPTSQIPAMVMAVTQAAHSIMMNNLNRGGQFGSKNIMAGLYVPEKNKIYLSSIPRKRLNQDMKTKPSAFRLTVDDYHGPSKIPHAEHSAYAMAVLSGAQPGEGSYMAAYGNYEDGNTCVECCQNNCQPFLKSKRIGYNGEIFQRSRTPSPDARARKSQTSLGKSRSHRKRHEMDVPEDSILARDVSSSVARPETVLHGGEDMAH